MKRLRTLTSFQIFKSEIKKNKKPIVVHVLFKAYPMIPCRSNLAGADATYFSHYCFHVVQTGMFQRSFQRHCTFSKSNCYFYLLFIDRNIPEEKTLLDLFLNNKYFTLYRQECSVGPPGIPRSGSASHGRTGPWPASVPTALIYFIKVCLQKLIKVREYMSLLV
jgi:hypothetical protein